ncbi:MAG: restriction endonuclease [Christensenellaceae bacterium]|nr:restriction endonuclease [Christensenellaceae bacterium]
MSKKYWLHRISNEWDVSYKLLDDGYLSVGWSVLASSGIEKVTSETERSIIMSNEGFKTKTEQRGLDIFLQFNQGDIVVVPLFDGKFSIYEIVGEPMPITKLAGYTEFISKDNKKIVRGKEGLLCRSENNKTVDVGFVVKVKSLKKSISRYDYADSKLTSKMRFPKTNADISAISESIEKVIKAEEPINFYAETIVEMVEVLLKKIKELAEPNKLEKLVRWYFERLGASKAEILAKNSTDKWDGADADVVAEFDSLRTIFYVQVKFHDGKTNEWAVKQISMYKKQCEQNSDEYAVIPWVITTADDFSDRANIMAEENNVQLITGIEFARMLVDIGITDINKAFE